MIIEKSCGAVVFCATVFGWNINQWIPRHSINRGNIKKRKIIEHKKIINGKNNHQEVVYI